VSLPISHERSVVEAYQTDRWVHTVATARWFTECGAAQEYCRIHAGRLALPLLMLVGEDDRIASADAARTVFSATRAADKQLIGYPGYFHEIFNETGRGRVFSDLEAWLQKHL